MIHLRYDYPILRGHFDIDRGCALPEASGRAPTVDLFSAIAGKALMLTILDGIVTIIASSFSYYLYLQTRTHSRVDSSGAKHTTSSQRDGFIIINTVSHARYLPKPSSHAFVYPTLTLFLNVQVLTAKKLNLGFRHGFLFGTGTIPWARLTNIRPAAYLIDDGVQGKNLVERFHEFVKVRGLDLKEEDVRDVWLLTSPSYFGFEGINPLSVWFCYGRDHRLKMVLLEVHNTFGERHVYVLRTGVDEDPNKPQNIEHQWTIPRQFHVSPFNDRSGYYACAISGSLHPHTAAIPPLPTIRLNLLTSAGDLKLTAITRANTSQPLNISSLLLILFHHPFILFLSLIRISYQAAKLHYSKRLDVYARPEPVAPDGSVEKALGSSSNPHQGGNWLGFGVGWQPEGWVHRRAKERVCAFLGQRVKDLDITVDLISSNSTDQRRIYHARTAGTVTLSIHYRTPLFFVLLLVLPSATHTLFLGSKAERLFTVSDEEIFLEVFEPRPHTRASTTQRLRKWCLPVSSPPRNLPSPPVHVLDKEGAWDWEAALVTGGYYGMEWLETALYSLFKARFVPGEEPWNGWERVKRGQPRAKVGGIGSIRRDAV